MNQSDSALNCELVFKVIQEPDGGYVAQCLTEGIVTQGDSWEELKNMVKEAVEAYFFDAPKIVQLFFFALPAGSNLRSHAIKCTDVCYDSAHAPGTRLPRPLTSPKTPRFRFSRPNVQLCLSPFAATHARNVRVTLSLPHIQKWLFVSSFTCHTYEKAGVSPQGFVRSGWRSPSGIVQWEVSRRRRRPILRARAPMASLLPSGENRNLMILPY